MISQTNLSAEQRDRLTSVAHRLSCSPEDALSRVVDAGLTVLLENRIKLDLSQVGSLPKYTPSFNIDAERYADES